MPQCLLKPPHGIVAYDVGYRRDLESMKGPDTMMACSVRSLNIEQHSPPPLEFFQVWLGRPPNDGVNNKSVLPVNQFQSEEVLLHWI